MNKITPGSKNQSFGGTPLQREVISPTLNITSGLRTSAETGFSSALKHRNIIQAAERDRTQTQRSG